MFKKLGKFLFSSAVAGAAIYGVYCYFQNKEKAAVPVDDTDDDFDDFNEDLDDDTVTEDVQPKEHSYIPLNLDKAEAFATEAFHKAKEVLADSVAQVKETVKAVKDSQAVAESSFTDLTAVQKEKAEESAETVSEAVSNAKEAASEVISETKENLSEAVSDGKEAVSETVSEVKENASEVVSDMQESVAETASDVKEAAAGKVEEFFDDSNT